MAQNIQPKQQNFVSRYAAAVQALKAACDNLTALDNEWSGLGYAPGAPVVDGTNWNMTDAAVEAILPGATAAILNSGVGGATAVVTAFNNNAGYLLPLIP